MISTQQGSTVVGSVTPDSRNGHVREQDYSPVVTSILALWNRFGPFILSSVLLILGYLHYAPGAAYSLSMEHYRAWSFPAFRYSDLIWLYLRDGLDRHPIPYVDYPLEYPPLTGLLSWSLSWAPDLPAYFTLAYAVLAASALLTIWSLQRLNGANVWLFAASPALFLYTGHQWDMAAIGLAALGLLAIQRDRDGWGVLALVTATSLKLFPVVFVAALIVERLRDRRYRSAVGLATGFAGGTALFNFPVALANYGGWSFFFRWNRDRLADSGVWVLWRSVPTEDLTRWSLVAAIAGGVALTVLAFRTRGPLLIPLGATYLLWWLLVNKTFTTHLMLWAILGIALLSAPLWLWSLTTAVDLIGFQLGNYLNLYNIPDFRHTPLIRKAVENIYDPVQLARSIVLLGCTLWGIHVLRLERLRGRYFSPYLTFSPQARLSVPLLDRLRDRPIPRLEPRRLLIATALTASFIAATVVMTWPYALHLSDATVVGFDPYLQIWLSEWIQHALATNPLGLYDANIFYPFAQTLAYTDANIPGALVAAPLRRATGDPILTNSLLVLMSFVLAAAGIYAVVVYLTGNRGAAFIAGLAYAFLPYRMVHLWHLNWLEGALLPWMLLALLRLIDRPSIWRGIALGLVTAALVLVSFYFSLQAALICSIVVFARYVAQRQLPSREFLRSSGVALLVTTFIAVPLYVPYLNVREEQQLERTIDDAEQYKALPESYLQLAPWDAPNRLQQLLGIRSGPNESLTEVGQERHADGHQHAEIVIEDALYPGLVALFFAIVGVLVWRTRRWLAIALALIGLVAVVLSFGPTFGARHESGQPLPYGWLFDHAPFFRSMRVPARLGGLANLMVVVLAGLGLAVSWQRLRMSPRFRPIAQHPLTGPLLVLALAALVLADLWTGPIPIESIDRGSDANAAAVWLAAQPAGPVMEFPAESVFADPAAASVRRHYGETLFWSTVHWNPVVNGNSGFIPRAYSDFIERFVGQLPRPDGTITPRISHVDLDTTPMLSQIGVRYLVFHRSQYRAEDWSAVASELATLVEIGVLTPAGDHGEATIFILNPAVPSIAPPEIRIFAPTLLTPESAWSPWVGVESLAGTPTALALRRPTRMEISWYDEDGMRLWNGSGRIPLPAVMDDQRLICGQTECLTSRAFDDPTRLPPPDPAGSWNPREPGHYIIRAKLIGDMSLDCKFDLDLVDSSTEVRARSGDDPFRWAECRSESANPVNNPGALPFELSPPSVTLVEETAVVDVALTPRTDEEVRGWFILAPPGVADPWNEAVFQSQVQQRLLSANAAAPFEWTAPVGAKVEPGIYGLTVWFHRQGPDGWEHAAGGDIELAPVIVDDDRRLRWAGPVRARLAIPSPAFVAGRTTQLELAVSGTSNQIACASQWRLFVGEMSVASGDAGDCTVPEVAIPATVDAGTYRLQIDLYAIQGDNRRLSDAVTLPVTVTVTAVAGAPS